MAVIFCLARICTQTTPSQAGKAKASAPMELTPNLHMKNFKPIAVYLILLSSLFMIACDGVYTDDTKSFDKKLRRTWVSNETGLYSGSLKIDAYTITIDGYGEDWTSLVGDDPRRPFKDFSKSWDISEKV